MKNMCGSNRIVVWYGSVFYSSLLLMSVRVEHVCLVVGLRCYGEGCFPLAERLRGIQRNVI